MSKLSGKSVEKKCQLFRATNYFSLMSPCFILLKLHGLFPYKRESNKFVLSKIGNVISTITITLYMLLLGFILYHMDVSTALEYDSVPGTLQGHCYLLLGWLLAVFYYKRSNSQMNLLNNIAKISSRVPTILFYKLSRIVHAGDLIGFIFLLAQIPNLYSKRPLLTASKVLDMYTTLIVYLMDVLYVNSVFVIGICFKYVNDKLNKLKCDINRGEPHMLRRIYHVKYNSVILTDIQLIMKEHNEISELVQELNNTFSLQLIATVTMTFAEITFSLYFYILQLVGSTEINLEKQIWYSYFITSVSYYAIKLAAIVWVCENSKSQAIETGIIVHQMLNETTDRGISEELQLFSLQLLHRDNNFSARGLTINAVLLTSIVGGITTYLLILIQFLVSSNTCDDFTLTTTPSSNFTY